MPSSMMEYTLESLLNDKDLRLDFIFYVNKIHAQESLLFWMEVEMFKRIVDSDECFKQAKLLYFRYIHPSSRSQINVSHKLKDELDATMASGIWDPTLYNAIQASVHECIKFSIVRDFCEYTSKRRTVKDPDPDSAACVMLNRYEGALQRHDSKDKDLGGSLRSRPALSFGWLKKKSSVDSKPHKKEKGSFLGKSRAKAKQQEPANESLTAIPEDVDTATSATANNEDQAIPQRERLTQQRLQQQIQLLRSLHQHQHENYKEADNIYSTMEFASTTTNATPLAKSVSMPTIVRGVSVATFKSPRS